MIGKKIAAIGAIVAAAVLGGGAVLVVNQLNTKQDAATAQQQAKDVADPVAALCASDPEIARRIGPACKKAAEVRDSPAPPTPGLDPAALRTAARSALDEYCSTRNQCRGKDGATPNFDGIVNAVVSMIPIPKDGASGSSGANGKDGQDGKDGQSASPEQVTAAAISAVNNYCGQENQPCRGPAGANGQNGKDGAPGPTCPDGYELRDALITAPDRSTYAGKACVDPGTSKAPSRPTTSALPTPKK